MPVRDKISFTGIFHSCYNHDPSENPRANLAYHQADKTAGMPTSTIWPETNECFQKRMNSFVLQFPPVSYGISA